MLSIKDKDGTIYEFEDHKKYDVKLHCIRGNRIIGSYISKATNTIVPISIYLNGQSALWGYGDEIALTPYDKNKDLKQAYSEGAIIEYLNTRTEEYLDGGSGMTWRHSSKYRIKDNISIESFWYHHKILLKALSGYNITSKEIGEIVCNQKCYKTLEREQ